MTELELAKQSGCARIDSDYQNTLKVGITLTLSDSSQFTVSTKESLWDYKLVHDEYIDGFFIIDKVGRRITNKLLMREVITQMSYWGITSFTKKCDLQASIRNATTIEEILSIVW